MLLEIVTVTLVTTTFFNSITATELDYPEPECTDTRNVGTVRLMEGLVEVCMEERRWVSVCADDFWDADDATVVCRHLGRSTKGAIAENNTHNSNSMQMYITKLDCSGTEKGLLDCHMNGTIVYETKCVRSASVTCNPAHCRDGELRLQDGSTRFEGRVEVCFQQQWGTISANGWGKIEANIACGQLGFSDQNAANTQGANEFPEGTGPIFLGWLKCGQDDDNSRRIIDCPRRSDPLSFRHNHDSGVKCIPADCEHNQVRLSSGTNGIGNNTGVIYGNVEVCLDQQWGSVCNTNWDELDAQVVCAQLGFFGKSFATSQSYLGTPPIDPIFMDNIQCNGTESTLMDCARTQDTVYCSYSEVAGAICTREIEGAPMEQLDMETLGLIVAVCVLGAFLGISIIIALSVIIIHTKVRAAARATVSPIEKYQTTEAPDYPQGVNNQQNQAIEEGPYDELTTNHTYAELENYSPLQHKV